MQGSLEERLPWLSIVLPKWFSKEYPDLATNLKNNQDVVTSPFDVHATLQHLLLFPKTDTNHKTQSLLTRIDPTRTCSQAGMLYIVNNFVCFDDTNDDYVVLILSKCPQFFKLFYLS